MNMEQYDVIRYRKEGIAGWLILLTIGLAISVIRNTYAFVEDIAAIIPYINELVDTGYLLLFIFFDLILCAAICV